MLLFKYTYHQKNNFPLFRIYDLFAHLYGIKITSKINLKNSYHQIKI